MLKKSIGVLSLAIMAFTSTPLLAGSWGNQSICSAAVKTYFFLDSRPTSGPMMGGRYSFLSDAGNLYFCDISGNVARFFWVNNSGEDMVSTSTTFEVVGDTLEVTTDMMKETFSHP